MIEWDNLMVIARLCEVGDYDEAHRLTGFQHLTETMLLGSLIRDLGFLSKPCKADAAKAVFERIAA